MTELFLQTGHLSDEGLQALIDGTLDEMQRLEAAEHLSFCDECLTRYTALLTGDVRQNANRAGNLMRSKFYVCPICGNVVYALGEGSFSCCGVQLVPCEAEEACDGHAVSVERIEDEWYVTLDHPMQKNHFISFIAYVTMDGAVLKKLYPEQEAAARFRSCWLWPLP